MVVKEFKDSKKKSMMVNCDYQFDGSQKQISDHMCKGLFQAVQL